MFKSFAKCFAVAALMTVGATGASAQSADWDSDQDGYYRYCDAAACYTYWNTGTPDDPSWTLISVEPVRGGGREVN